MTVACLVVAWLFIQAALIFLPALDAPLWVTKIVIVFLVLALLIALAPAWAFEITSQGITLESEDGFSPIVRVLAELLEPRIAVKRVEVGIEAEQRRCERHRPPTGIRNPPEPLQDRDRLILCI